MIRRHPILSTFLVLLLILIVGGVVKARQPKPLIVRVEPVQQAEVLTEIVSASGQIRAHEEVNIQTEIAGQIVELPVREGQRVARGDVLVRIDPFQAETMMSMAESNHAAARADVVRVEAAIAQAEANLARQLQQIKSSEAALEESRIQLRREENRLRRQAELLRTDALSQDQYEEFEAQKRVTEMRVEAALAGLEQSRAQLRAQELLIEEQHALAEASRSRLRVAQSELDQARDRLGKLTLVSPLDGMIIRLNVETGEQAVPGNLNNPLATLMTIADLSRIEAEIEVDETDIVEVELGDETRIMVDALPGQDLAGRVSEISTAPVQAGSNEQSGRDFRVTVTLDDPPPTLRMGMSCEAEITIDTARDVPVIPIQALTMRTVDVDEAGRYIPPPKPDEGDAANTPEAETTNKQEDLEGVFVIDEAGRARFRPIETGVMGETQIEVIAGLEFDERVMTGPLDALRQIEEWKPVKVEGAP